MGSLPTGSWRWIVVNSSGGKDSQTALAETVRAADAAGFPRSNIVVSHQDLRRVEWSGTMALAEEQAAHYDLRFEVSGYRNNKGESPSLLDYVRKRGKWPDSKNRYCTSDFKRGPGSRVITKLYREAPGDILQVFGFRAAESPSRSKKKPLTLNKRLSTKSRMVKDWLPIHDWTEEEVWTDIKQSGVRWHEAYDLGMPRLSCCFCIFAPRAALITAGRANPDLLNDYVALEAEIGHDFQHKKPIHEIKQAVDRGENPGTMDGKWNM